MLNNSSDLIFYNGLIWNNLASFVVKANAKNWFSFSALAPSFLSSASTPWLSSGLTNSFSSFLLLMYLKKLLLLTLASLARCSSNSFLACLISLLHLTCQNLCVFLFSFRHTLHFLKDAFLSWMPSPILLLNHAWLLLDSLLLFLICGIHFSWAFSIFKQLPGHLLAFHILTSFNFKLPNFCVISLPKIVYRPEGFFWLTSFLLRCCIWLLWSLLQSGSCTDTS